MKAEVRRSDLRCSFCNKSQNEVRKLVAGPDVHICDECVDICTDIISEERPAAPDAEPSAARCRICHGEAAVVASLSVSGQLICPKCIELMRPFFAADDRDPQTWLDEAEALIESVRLLHEHGRFPGTSAICIDAAHAAMAAVLRAHGVIATENSVTALVNRFFYELSMKRQEKTLEDAMPLRTAARDLATHQRDANVTPEAARIAFDAALAFVEYARRVVPTP